MAGKATNAYLRLLRPFTLLPPFVVTVAGGMMAIGYYSLEISQYIIPIILTGLVMAMINGASNALNQVFDVDIDRINKPYRPIPRGDIGIRDALAFSLVLYAVCILSSLYISPRAFIFALMFASLTILYSVPPIRLKQRLWASNITIATARSYMLLLAGWCAVPAASIMAMPIWYVGVILFIFLVGASATKDFTDIEGDKAHGMKTLPAVYGAKRAVLLISPFFVLPYLLIPVGTVMSWLPLASLQLTPMIVWAFYAVMVLGECATVPGKKFENSPMWVHMYLMMMALAIGFALVFLFG
ncbi:MAG: hypothetical protein DRN20_00900 [Thermoplasmata archaeon]|nr:MAG: hypothetical protein DRN20_00900 [Thermoplasmata archaeon]